MVQADHLYPVALQLGFGSFLGIIGSNLVENKRQMVVFMATQSSSERTPAAFLWMGSTLPKVAHIGPRSSCNYLSFGKLVVNRPCAVGLVPHLA